MPIRRIADSSLSEMNSHTAAFVGACGYETRAAALAPLLSSSIKSKYAVAFQEYGEALSRPSNERNLQEQGFDFVSSSGSDTKAVDDLMNSVIEVSTRSGGAIAFDISSMTRVWHGAIVRRLIKESHARSLETFFVYVPGKFQPPFHESPYNEIVAPVDGFASLAPPNVPAALIIGLGYDKERAFGLEELLDPKRTILMIPKSGQKGDKFYAEVLKSNEDILAIVSQDWVFEYPLREPTACFGILESICLGLLSDYRVVLASLGPKLYGLICFLISAKQPAISVWRVSSGVHVEPRDVLPDIEAVVALRVSWGPEEK